MRPDTTWQQSFVAPYGCCLGRQADHVMAKQECLPYDIDDRASSEGAEGNTLETRIMTAVSNPEDGLLIMEEKV